MQITGTCDIGTFDNGMSVIKTPNYPDTYPLSKQCTWNIKVETGQYIELEFKDFNLGPDSTCRFEWLQVHDGKSSISPALSKKLCGTSKPDNIVSNRNQVFLRWKSDDSRSFKGFHISVSIPGK